MATKKAFAFGAVNICSSDTHLVVRPILAPDEFRRARAGGNPFAIGSARANDARFDAFMMLPEASSVAGRYYLGAPDALELFTGVTADLKRDAEGRLVPVDARGEELLASLDGFNDAQQVKLATADMKAFDDWMKMPPLKVRRGIQRVLVSVAFDDPRKAVAIEVEHRDEQALIGSMTFVFPPGRSAEQDDCL